MAMSLLATLRSLPARAGYEQNDAADHRDDAENRRQRDRLGPTGRLGPFEPLIERRVTSSLAL